MEMESERDKKSRASLLEKEKGLPKLFILG